MRRFDKKRSFEYNRVLKEININTLFSIDREFFNKLSIIINESLKKYSLQIYNLIGGKMICSLNPYDDRSLYSVMVKMGVKNPIMFLKELYLQSLDNIDNNTLLKNLFFNKIDDFNVKSCNNYSLTL
jgi:hypothetical protein